jgi:hypothetical protein
MFIRVRQFIREHFSYVSFTNTEVRMCIDRGFPLFSSTSLGKYRISTFRYITTEFHSHHHHLMPLNSVSLRS